MSEETNLKALKNEPSNEIPECIAKVLRGKHCLIIGSTGSGKTYWVAKVARRYLRRFIFVNPNLEEVVANITTAHYYEPEEVIEGLTNRENRIEFIPDEDVKIALEQLKELREGLFKMAAEIDIKTGSWWVNMILDEVQSYAWKGSRQDIDVFATRGRRYGIRTFFITQRPQNVSSTIINNIQNQVIFQTGLYESMYFQNYRIPIEEHKKWLMEPYHYILFDGVEVVKCTPIGQPSEVEMWRRVVRESRLRAAVQEQARKQGTIWWKLGFRW